MGAGADDEQELGGRGYTCISSHYFEFEVGVISSFLCHSFSVLVVISFVP